MTRILADRVLETSTNVGAGPYLLDGAVTGFRSLGSVAASLDTFPYFVEGVGLNGTLSGEWEVGIGTMNPDGSVVRTSIQSSSSGNAAVAWGAGTRRIGVSLSAAYLSDLVSRSEINAHIAPAVNEAIGNLTDFAGVYQLST